MQSRIDINAMTHYYSSHAAHPRAGDGRGTVTIVARRTRTAFDAVNPGMPAALKLADLPRLTEAELGSLDNYSVMPAAMDDEQVARRDHAAEIANAMQKTQELIKAHQPVVTAILNGLSIQRLAELAKEPTP